MMKAIGIVASCLVALTVAMSAATPVAAQVGGAIPMGINIVVYALSR